MKIKSLHLLSWCVGAFSVSPCIQSLQNRHGDLLKIPRIFSVVHQHYSTTCNQSIIYAAWFCHFYLLKTKLQRTYVDEQSQSFIANWPKWKLVQYISIKCSPRTKLSGEIYILPKLFNCFSCKMNIDPLFSKITVKVLIPLTNLREL